MALNNYPQPSTLHKKVVGTILLLSIKYTTNDYSDY